MRRFIFTSLLIFSVNLLAASNSMEDLQDLVGKKNYANAIKMGEQILGEKPQSARVQFLTAYAYQMDGQTVKAESLYRMIIEQNPNLPEPRNNLALIYLANGDYDAASKLLVDAINTHKSYATAYQNLNRIYTGIASEAYRRALSESNEPAKYTQKIELVAMNEIESLSGVPDPLMLAGAEPSEQPDKQHGDVRALLNRLVSEWAMAWSNKDFARYTSFYSTEHRPDFETHSAWVEHRRQRIMRPGYIKIGVTGINIRAQNANRAIIDFKQSFDSPGYSDRVVKRLGFRRVGTEWKIIDERVLSVL